eukprot:2552030-Ditylum_brightwellii.AAC.1
MTDERLSKLRELGYSFDDPNVVRRNQLWEERIEELKIVRERFGDINIVKRKDNLGRWFVALRREYRIIQGKGQKKQENNNSNKEKEIEKFSNEGAEQKYSATLQDTNDENEDEEGKQKNQQS